MKIRMVPDVMFSQCFDYLAAPALLQHSSLFSNHFESRSDIPLRKHFREPFRCVIIRRQQVVFGIEPKDDVDLRISARLRRVETRSSDRETCAKNQVMPDSL